MRSKIRSARTARRKEPKDERMMERRGRSGETFEKRILERKRRTREPEYMSAELLAGSPARLI
jgi:hypothetical protein